MQKIELTEDEINLQWTSFKVALDQVWQQPDGLANEDISFWVDANLKPYLKRIEYILLEEDNILIQNGQRGAIGECMEYCIRNNMFMEVIALAQSDHPEGMFIICLDFIIQLILEIKSMPIIHNDKMHKSLIQMTKFINQYLSNDIIEVNDPQECNLRVRVILDFL